MPRTQCFKVTLPCHGDQVLVGMEILNVPGPQTLTNGVAKEFMVGEIAVNCACLLQGDLDH